MSTTPLTARNTIEEWLNHPVGGPVLRGFLAQTGSDEASLGPAKALKLQQLVDLSQGQMPQAAVDEMVKAANGGVMPELEETALPTVPGRFENKTVIVTGAGSGIGRATASRIAREGGRVIAVDIAETKIKELAEELGDAIVPVAADLTDLDAVDRIIAAAGGQVDGLANVAGINDDFSPLHEVSDAMWQKIFAVNVDGLVRLTRAVLPGMLEARKGTIVNVTSEAGLRGSASGVAYTASKHAVVGITKSAAFMYAKEGIRINAVAPGGVATGIPMGGKTSEYGEARLTPARVMIPGLASAEDLAASITFLLSDDSVNINGAILPSDGGWSAG
ncbi:MULTISPECIES: SDR family NAD(P)-dependent oxidoreductase [Arthrobacter]|uniref:SDR family NAD(P)-dependent oxidoreductase n=1 Tax=Arthrobacter TaxID=1663 RepID=UPI001D13DC3A|nr:MULTISPECIES: SDR family oxidoreductase [Arthrobacter]MCC3281723.1 SDR family oxidoreductase [Arthrobacter caoxuetaonis]MCC9194834.1 SDR family oxidoreductase [Arthrobacter sp. zg-Y916]